MRYLRALAVLGFLAVFSVVPVSAQEEVRSYLEQTNPLLLRFKTNVEEFLPAIKDLREKKDVVGLKNAGDVYAERWASLVADLDKVQPPSEAVEYHKAFRRLCELQQESNVILAETLQQRIDVVLQSRKMKESGASQEEIDTYVKENSPEKESLTARTGAIKEETQKVDAIFKSERRRLLELIEPKSE